MNLNYFAFGSNLSSPRLRQRLPGVEARCVATLAGHRLCWHKNGRDQSGKCDIVASDRAGDLVYGVVYLMTRDEGLELDRYETAGFGYARKQVGVVGLDGSVIDAFTYYATDIRQHQQPYHWYKEHVLRGALEHDFPAWYVEQIAAVDARHDDDLARQRRELSIYRQSP